MKGWKSRLATTLIAAAFIGSTAVSAATLYYENTKLVEENGQPVAKIVVGAGAGVSDGIAAANIASAIAQQAYARQNLNVRLSGTPACTVSGGTGSAAGSCEVSDKKVTIEITVPGQLANAHQFTTLITDTIDKTPGNRMNTLGADNYTNDVSTSDTTSNIPSPLRGVSGFNGTNAHGANLYMIGASQFNGFQVADAKESKTGGNTYPQEIAFWVGTGAPANGVYYDNGAAYRQVIARPNSLAYSIRFLGNNFGIPVCTATNSSGLWAYCAGSDTNTDATVRHRLKINFLGADWVISGMTPPDGTVAANQLNTTGPVIAGGQIKLAKEADDKIISIGDTIDAGTLKIRLSDISMAEGSGNAHPAILDVLDSNGVVIDNIKVSVGETSTYNAGNNQKIKIHVYQTAGGITLAAKWAEIAIYTDEITLQDGAVYNPTVYSNTDENWGNIYASLLWKTRDASSTNGQPNSLREIVLYVDNVKEYMGEDRMKATDSLVFPKENPVYRFTYNGLDLTKDDYESLTIASDPSEQLTIGTTADCSSPNATYAGSFLKVSSSNANAFGGATSNLLGTDRVKEFYIDPMGNFTMTGGAATQTQPNVFINVSAANNNTQSQIFWKPQGCRYLKVANFTTTPGQNAGMGVLSYSASTNGTIAYDTVGDASSSPAFGMMQFYFDGRNAFNATYLGVYSANITGAIGEIVIQEDAGQLNSTAHHFEMIRIPVQNITTAAATGDWQFKSTDSSTSVAFYNALNLSGDVTPSVLRAQSSGYELPLYTERGSKVTDVSLKSVSISSAKKIANAKFTFTAASTAVGQENTETWTAKEGDTRTVGNGIVLKVKKIDQTVGSCTASGSGAPTCTATAGTMTAVADPAVTSVLTPYTGDLKMVIKDSDAAGVSGTLITVGGSAVNTVTAQAAQTGDANIDFNQQNVVVKVVGNKIVVAGLTADNTMTAANAFIAALKTQ